MLLDEESKQKFDDAKEKYLNKEQNKLEKIHNSELNKIVRKLKCLKQSLVNNNNSNLPNFGDISIIHSENEHIVSSNINSDVHFDPFNIDDNLLSTIDETVSLLDSINDSLLINDTTLSISTNNCEHC